MKISLDHKVRTLALALGLSALGCTSAFAEGGDPALVKQYVDEATQVAGKDMLAPLTLCKTATDPASQPTDEQMHAILPKLMANSYVEPVKVFDNLYFLGTSWVSAWALTTSTGIILFDALDNDQEARDSIEGGLIKLGLDPAKIEIIVVTHAHGDHYGGVNYLVNKYHPKVVMSDTDWKELEKPTLQFDDPNWGRPPKRDVAVKDGDTVKVGSTVVHLYVTAGHTPGTLSLVFPVLNHDSVRTAVLWGGTAFNFGHITSRLQSYIASADRFEALAKSEHIEVLLSNHPNFDESFAKMKRMQANPSGPNPYVIGQDAVSRFMKVAGLCARATLASYDAGELGGLK